ncbi:MAG: TspO/MBR family protein [Pseudomonadota bacterium]
MTQPTGLNATSLRVALVGSLLTAFVGGMLTPIDAWYAALAKPAFQPPNWAFGPAWTVIFIMAAYAAHTAWQRAPSSSARRWVIILFTTNAILNVGWSFLFFYSRRPDLALYESCLLWLSILAIVIATVRYARLSAILMLPYLAWVTFATVLNRAIVDLNAPFT